MLYSGPIFTSKQSVTCRAPVRGAEPRQWAQRGLRTNTALWAASMGSRALRAAQASSKNGTDKWEGVQSRASKIMKSWGEQMAEGRLGNCIYRSLTKGNHLGYLTGIRPEKRKVLRLGWITGSN